MLTDLQLDDLITHKYIVLDDVLLPAIFEALQAEAQASISYRPAQVADGLHQRIRSDVIAWIEPDDDTMPAGQNFLLVLDALSTQFNREFFAGICCTEAHYARYEQGARYTRHVDNRQGRRDRVFSCVFYLNSTWTVDDGGALVLYPSSLDPQDATQHSQRLLPIGNRMVIFDSNLAHEVEVATKSRHSIAAWLRNSST